MQPSDDGGTAVGAAALCVASVAWTRRSLGLLAAWAADRSISPNSLSGISVLLALCAAAWFSGGAQDGGQGMIAMVGWLLVLAAARGLAGYVGRQHPGAHAGAATVPSFGWVRAVCGAGAECAIYGGMAAGSQPTVLMRIWPLAVTTVISIAIGDLLGACSRAALGAGYPSEIGRTTAVNWWTGRLLDLPSGLRGLLALLAFAVAGAPAALFAVLTLEVVSVVTTIAMLGKITPARQWTGHPAPASLVPAEPAPAEPDAALTAAAGLGRGGASKAVGAAASQVQAPAGRVAAVVRVAGSSSGSSAVRLIPAVARGGTGAGDGPASRSRAETSRSAGRSCSAEVSGAKPSRWAEASKEAGPSRLAEASEASGRHRLAEASGAAWPHRWAGASGVEADPMRSAREVGAAVAPGAAVIHDAAAQPVAQKAAAQDVILALRDDGAASRWAGRLVQGNLIPLPPALGGLVATAMLAALGLRNLPGFIALTPPVVMMLAAPGSSHRHDRRFDWLVPVLLALAQYVYLATLGFALAVPRAVVFSACAVIFVWYAGVIAGAREVTTGQAAGGTREPATDGDSGHARSARSEFLGWETRMLTVGLAAAMGLAVFGYLGLSAYLGALICRRVMTG